MIADRKVTRTRMSNQAASQTTPIPSSNAVNGKVRSTPIRKPNAALRSREYLTPSEVERLMKAAGKSGRYGHRDATLILIAYRHGLRVGELVSLRWDQVDFKASMLHVRRSKNGTPSTHPLRGPELRALRQLRRDWRKESTSLSRNAAGR